MKYKKELDFTYALGATVVFEAIRNMPENIQVIYYKEKTDDALLTQLGDAIPTQYNIPIKKDNKIFNIISAKDNYFLIAKVKKWRSELSDNNLHVLLVNPANTGNLGTIIRSALGFDCQDIAIITPSVDHFDPQTIRASIGAVFSVRVELFESVDEYIAKYSKRNLYMFYLDGKEDLRDIEPDSLATTTLVFGNEATGLPERLKALGRTIKISHTTRIDSLNLQSAVTLALFHFTNGIEFN